MRPRPFPLPRGLAAVISPLLLAGLLPLDPEVEARWVPSGAWQYPVGSPFDFTVAASDSVPGYRLSRGTTRDGRSHTGADLLNGRAGDEVRAASAGLVVNAAASGHHGGYGAHVVIAHRVPDGSIVYSIYAHLKKHSLRVRNGDRVRAGEVVGRVGRTGRATTNHLHFEIRTPRDPLVRWERAPIADPLAFVSSRLPAARADSTWARDYLLWAEGAALIGPGSRGQTTLTNETWAEIRNRCRPSAASGPAGAASLRRGRDAPADTTARSAARAEKPMRWSELIKDLGGLDRASAWVAAPVLDIVAHRARCVAVLGAAYPARRVRDLSRLDHPPTVAEACLLLADLMLGDATAGEATGGP